MIAFTSICPICMQAKEFRCIDDFWHAREGLRSGECPYNSCMTRERALATVLFSLYDRLVVIENLHIHEAAPANRGLSLWMAQHCRHYVRSGYFPDRPFGQIIDGLRNENLENQTFEENSLDLVIHLDVMEHLFNPMQALRECYRTLNKTGRCIFTAPTYWDLFASRQVAFCDASGPVTTIEKPEYHGNPQDQKGGSLVTWRYGYDLPSLITRETGFNVEVRRFQSFEVAALGVMNEVYILTKTGK